MSSTEYETPSYLYDRLSEAFGPFDLDAAASKENNKAGLCITEEMDALGTKTWAEHFVNPPEGTEIIRKVWLNPPWGPRDPVFPWVKKAVSEIGLSDIDLICMLLPFGRWAKWHEFIIVHAEMVRVTGRIPFLLDGAVAGTPPACNVVAVIRRNFSGYKWPTGFSGATVSGVEQ